MQFESETNFTRFINQLEVKDFIIIRNFNCPTAAHNLFINVLPTNLPLNKLNKTNQGIIMDYGGIINVEFN